MAAAIASSALAAGRPSLNAYFQSTLKDEAYQKKTSRPIPIVVLTPTS